MFFRKYKQIYIREETLQKPKFANNHYLLAMYLVLDTAWYFIE